MSGEWLIDENTRVEGLHAILNGSIEFGSDIVVEFVGSEIQFAPGANISFNACINVTLDGIRVISAAKTAVTFGDSRDILLRNSFFNISGLVDGSEGFRGGWNCRNITIENCTVRDFHKSVFLFGGSAWNCTEIFINNCTYERSPGSFSPDGEVQFVECSNVTFSNNIIQDLGSDGIEIYRSANFHIFNNTVRGGSTSFHVANGPVSYLYIANNTLIESSAIFSDCDHVYIEDNDFQRSDLWMNNSRDSIIANNIFDRPSRLFAANNPTNTNVTEVGNTFRGPDPFSFPKEFAFLIIGGLGIIAITYIVKKRRSRADYSKNF